MIREGRAVFLRWAPGVLSWYQGRKEFCRWAKNGTDTSCKNGKIPETGAQKWVLRFSFLNENWNNHSIVELDPDPALLMLGDEGQVQQILTNLLVDSLHSPFGAHNALASSHFALSSARPATSCTAASHFFCEQTSGRGTGSTNREFSGHSSCGGAHARNGAAQSGLPRAV